MHHIIQEEVLLAQVAAIQVQVADFQEEAHLVAVVAGGGGGSRF